MGQSKTVDQIKSALLRPSLTSKFSVEIQSPTALLNFFNNTSGEEFNMSCSEASLPGVSLNTQEITDDRHGVTERNAYRRMYDDRIDLTFYVEGSNYTKIRYFEQWINFIVGEDDASDRVSRAYNYKVKFPDSYKSLMKIRKFEKDHGADLTYNFIDSYPISISSMPLSYSSTDLLKCTVSMTYLRYIVL